MPVRVLAPEVVSKIAAGEVVERPASVAKELIDNSIDAGATHISVEARGGGLNLIRVVDNGAGMGADDASLAFQRYATSKISDLQDLDSIESLGFRGEALPSIAAVAEVEMLTRSADDLAGAYIRLKGGTLVGTENRACPKGTSVTVRHLFRNVPARLKFMKSSSTENSHVASVISHYSLAFPDVRFSLLLDGRMAVQTTGNGDLRDAMVNVYGLKTTEAMLPVGGRDSILWGLASQPSASRSSRNQISFFVNRRWVNSRLLVRAVMDAYKGLLMTGRYPIAVLHISLPPQDVDVNVHPAKTEVRFRDEQGLFSAVQRDVRAAVVSGAAVPEVRRQPSTVYRPGVIPDRKRLAEQVELFDASTAAGSLAGPLPQRTPDTSLPMLRILGQIASTYIIAEGPDGLYLIDQHAAHERILYERVLSQRASGSVEVQGMLEPLTVEVTPRQAEILKAAGTLIESYGFAIEPFGSRTYMLRTVPAALHEGDIFRAVIEILDSLAEEGGGDETDRKIAASIACHGAVRAGQVLKPEEIDRLVRDLELTELPHTCPHGRPTMIRFTSSQLEREFGRVL